MDEHKKAEEMEEKPEQVGPYQLREQVQQSARSQGEFTFEGVREAVRRMARAVPEAYEQRQPWRLGLGVASAAAACALLLGLVRLAPVFRPPNGPEPIASAPPASMSHEEPTAPGVTVEATASADAPALLQTTRPNPSAITYPLPAKPFRNQAKAPCLPKKGEVEINGGCWVELAKRPPCHEDQAEHQGKCYMPVAERPKPEPSVIEP